MHAHVNSMNLSDQQKAELTMLYELEQQKKEIECKDGLLEAQKKVSFYQAKAVAFAEVQLECGKTLLKKQQQELEEAQTLLKRTIEEVEQKKAEVVKLAKVIDRTKGLSETEKYHVDYKGYFYNAGGKGQKPSYTLAKVTNGHWEAGFKVEVKNMNGDILYKGFEPNFKPLDVPHKSFKRKNMGATVDNGDGNGPRDID
jgi:multidrug efflux pump subunit AcrA (membrane-fusion protein)